MRALSARAAGRRQDTGAALVEFALVLPVFMALVLGMFSGGLAYEHKQEVTNAAREAARFGATLALDQCVPSTQCGGESWAQLVQSIAVERSNGTLDAAQVCAALVSGPGTDPVAYDSTHTTAGGTAPCFTDNSADTGYRVQVSVSRGDEILALFFAVHVNVGSSAVAKYEAPPS